MLLNNQHRSSHVEVHERGGRKLENESNEQLVLSIYVKQESTWEK